MSGRLQSILTTDGPITIVVPTNYPARELGVALRVAHDLSNYHKLDANIITSSDAIGAGAEDMKSGNIVAIGHASASDLVPGSRGLPIEFDQKELRVSGRTINLPAIDQPGIGIISCLSVCSLH